MEESIMVYRNAFFGRLPVFLLGDRNSRSQPDIVFNFGTLCAKETGLTDNQSQKLDSELLKSQVIKEGSGKVSPHQQLIHHDDWLQYRNRHLSRGAILNEKNWWLFKNDMGMLGVIHKGREVHLALAGFPPEDLLWESQKDRPRVLGREIIMLKAADYSPVHCQTGDTLKDRHFIFRPKKSPSAMSYSDARRAIAAASSDSICDYLKTAKKTTIDSSSKYDEEKE